MSYLDDQVSAKAMIAEAGQAITLTPPVSGTYDTATGRVSGSAPTPVATLGVVLPYSKGLAHVPGSDIAAGDQQLLIPGDIDEPVIDTKATINGVDYVIKEVSPLSPAGTVIYYDCRIRSGQ